MKRFNYAVITALLIVIAGCTGNSAESKEQKAAPAKAEPLLPLTENTSGKVQIQTVSGSEGYPFNSYIITSSKGESVIVDPTEMPSRETIDLKPAAIICTHGHMDHVDMDFTDSYECPKIKYYKADIKTRDFRIYTVLSAHQGNTLGASNVIAIFEVDGLRIAHMGDIGQAKLTDEQLREIGKIDIAFMQFENSYSSMTLENEKGFTLIEQLNPAIIIPTHYTAKALPVLETRYGKITDLTNVFTVAKGDLPADTLTVYRILNTHKYL